MFHRVLAAGLKLRYEPAAWARHRHRRDIEGLRRQIYNNGRSYGVLLLKIWKTRSVPRKAVIVLRQPVDYGVAAEPSGTARPPEDRVSAGPDLG